MNVVRARRGEREQRGPRQPRQVELLAVLLHAQPLPERVRCARRGGTLARGQGPERTRGNVAGARSLAYVQ
jgi:hypothetical protein